MMGNELASVVVVRKEVFVDLLEVVFEMLHHPSGSVILDATGLAAKARNAYSEGNRIVSHGEYRDRFLAAQDRVG